MLMFILNKEVCSRKLDNSGFRSGQSLNISLKGYREWAFWSLCITEIAISLNTKTPFDGSRNM